MFNPDRIDMKNIRCGDLFWECEDGQQAQFEAMADAQVNGDVVTLQARDIETGQPQAFMMRLSAPAYAPRLYHEAQYGPLARNKE